jgi:recombination protein RecA
MSADLDRALAAIRKQYGEDAIHFAATTPAVARIGTGSIELDIATGGGFPVGRASRLYGSPGCGKSLLGWNLARGAQRAGKKVAYYNIEKQFDREYVQRLGVNVDDLILVEGTMIEDVVTIMETLLESVDVHILDSCSSAVSVDEMKGKVEDWHMGLGARAWSKSLKRILNRMRDQDMGNIILMIDQAREVFGAYGGGEKPPGGRMMEHTSSLTIHCRKGKPLFRDDDGLLHDDIKYAAKGSSGLTEPVGWEIQTTVRKSRVCKTGRTARIYYDSDKPGFDLAYEFSKVGVFYGTIQQSGAWYTLPSGARVQGMGKLRLAVLDDRKLREQIYKEAMEKTRPAAVVVE